MLITSVCGNTVPLAVQFVMQCSHIPKQLICLHVRLISCVSLWVCVFGLWGLVLEQVEVAFGELWVSKKERLLGEKYEVSQNNLSSVSLSL